MHMSNLPGTTSLIDMQQIYQQYSFKEQENLFINKKVKISLIKIMVL